jgi:hypothetical protein
MDILDGSPLQNLLKKFENNKNKCNYYSLCKFVKKKERKMKRKFKRYNILLTDETGVLIYNGRKENTWDNYKTGNIKYNCIKEVDLINKSEKNGYNYYSKLNKKGIYKLYLTINLGSNIQEYIEENGTSNNTLEFGSILLAVIAIVYMGYGYVFVDTIEAGSEVLSGETVSKEGDLYIILTNDIAFSVPIDELGPDNIENIIDKLDGVKFIRQTSDNKVLQEFLVNDSNKEEVTKYLERLKNSL